MFNIGVHLSPCGEKWTPKAWAESDPIQMVAGNLFYGEKWTLL